MDAIILIDNLSLNFSFPDHMYLKDCPHRPSYDPENKSFRKVNDKGNKNTLYQSP